MRTLIALAAGLALGASGYAAAQKPPPIEHVPNPNIYAVGNLDCRAVVAHVPRSEWDLKRLRCNMAKTRREE